MNGYPTHDEVVLDSLVKNPESIEVMLDVYLEEALIDGGWSLLHKALAQCAQAQDIVRKSQAGEQVAEDSPAYGALPPGVPDLLALNAALNKLGYRLGVKKFEAIDTSLDIHPVDDSGDDQQD